ncbi:LacI family DNA-binding transcriptional regulator [Solicola sp. PLA-1-18]|uniref:LacI family DNA-binding transcriptional regulator n=1 Tax=Solicola sp. PLA-1-18 TaxID=3380532 RepID=UPI003B768DE3
MSDRRPTLHDVAAEAGVSIKTVSRVVNGSVQVRDDLRVHVQEVVDRLHYVPNTVARNLKAGTGDTIGVVIDKIADPFFAALTSAVESTALESGLTVVFGSTGYTHARERSQVERMAMQQVRGLILAPVVGDHEYLARYRSSFPMVLVDRSFEIEGYDAVLVDDRGATRWAIEHLLAHGHRRIAFVGRDERFPTTSDRLDGYHDALQAAGVAVDPALVPAGQAEEDAAERAVHQLLAADPPTAIFSANPRASLGVVHALHTLGRTDIALVSFGDFPLARTLEPAVTCVDQDPHRIGAVATTQLLRRLGLDEGRDRIGPAERVVVPAELIPRGSGEIEVPA